MIKRRNILELIGKNRRKYHSCVITCYSLDFAFFEQRVLPALRLANIKNINILADGNYLEMAQEATTGKEFKHNKTYNFQPVYEKGVFHPKIMLLTGNSHGLLIIGSGNITSSGLSTNDEIWGAFHLNHLQNDNAALFGAVWQYLQPYLNKSLGFVPQKIEWIKKHSPWLETLPTTQDWIDIKSLNIQLKFIANTQETSTFQSLVATISEAKVKELIVIAPYYDKAGKFLKNLKKHFNPTKMRCFVDTNSGQIPSDLEHEIASQIKFYNWSDCKEDYDDIYNRLHAKILYFKFKNKEYLLLGSANATMAGMGTINTKAANGEAGILLKRKKAKKSWIKELNIKIPKKTITLSQTEHRGIEVSSIHREKYKYRILYSELRANEIVIYLDKECKNPVEVTVWNRLDIKIEASIKEINENIITVKVTDIEAVFKISLTENNVRISSFSIVHRLDALLRCNPDPNQEKLDILLEQDFTDGEGIMDLLQYVDYNWADEDTISVKKVSDHGNNAVREVSTDEQKQEYKILKAEEFNKISDESLLKQSADLSNATIKIAEFLRIYASGVFGKEDNFHESAEQKLFEDEEQQGEGETTDKNVRKRTDRSKEKRAMMKFFKRLSKEYSQKIENLLTPLAITVDLKTSINIKLLSSILIALDLIQLNYGSKIEIPTKDTKKEEEGITRQESFISIGKSNNNIQSVKGFIFNILGKFLLLSSAEYKHYEFEILNQKLLMSQTQLLIKSTCLILNTPWRTSEEIHKDVLLLNCLYFSLGDQLLQEDTLNEFMSKLEQYKTTESYKIPKFEQQLEAYKNDVLPKYMEWLQKYTENGDAKKTLICPIADLKRGSIIFNNTIGFNIIKQINYDGSQTKLYLSRAGYPYLNDEFILKNVQFGTMSVVYR